jgi:hypothetical protein
VVRIAYVLKLENSELMKLEALKGMERYLQSEVHLPDQR